MPLGRIALDAVSAAGKSLQSEVALAFVRNALEVFWTVVQGEEVLNVFLPCLAIPDLLRRHARLPGEPSEKSQAVRRSSIRCLHVLVQVQFAECGFRLFD